MKPFLYILKKDILFEYSILKLQKIKNLFSKRRIKFIRSKYIKYLCIILFLHNLTSFPPLLSHS